MTVPNRNYSSPSYRYGFQGQEKDDEVKGNGNSLNYTFRMHDPRIGRFFAVDPLTWKYPHYTPYSFSGNKVINSIELEGLEEKNIYFAQEFGDNCELGQPITFTIEGQVEKRIDVIFTKVSERNISAEPNIAEYLKYDHTEKVLKGYILTFEQTYTITTKIYDEKGVIISETDKNESEIRTTYVNVKNRLINPQESVEKVLVELLLAEGTGRILLKGGSWLFKSKVVANSRIGKLIDDVFEKTDHVIEGSKKSDHLWEVLVPDKNPAKIKAIIADVLENGKTVKYGKSGTAKVLDITENGTTRQVMATFKEGTNGEVKHFGNAFVTPKK